MSDLSVRIDLSDRVPVVTVVGDVDHHTWPTLAVMLANVVHAGNEKAVVDLSGVEFMDSGALKADRETVEIVRVKGRRAIEHWGGRS